jgi:hypothetical protein
MTDNRHLHLVDKLADSAAFERECFERAAELIRERRSVPPLSLDHMAQATRDHGMQDALDDAALQRIRARLNGKPRHIDARKSPSIFATLAADWREFWSEVADAPAHHAGFALMVFIASCVLIYGSAWVLVHTVLS